jgi:hypothetical protein
VLIQFIYQDNNYSIKKELVAKQLCDSVFKIITLPDSLEIEFITMSDSVYGETMLDSRFKNRIRINSVLTEREIIIPIVHELIHVHQIHTNKLQLKSNGTCVWNNKIYKLSQSNKLNNSEYSLLPWEIDVVNKQQSVLNEVFSQMLLKNNTNLL